MTTRQDILRTIAELEGVVQAHRDSIFPQAQMLAERGDYHGAAVLMEYHRAYVQPVLDRIAHLYERLPPERIVIFSDRCPIDLSTQ